MTNELRFDLSGLSKWGVRLVALVIVGDLILAANSGLLLGFFVRVEAGVLSPAELDAEGAAVDARSRLLAIAYAVLFATCAIVNAIWIYRASWNAGQMQPVKGRITPGWSVGWYFVPLLLFWKPMVGMTQIWNSSVDPTGDIYRSAPAFVGWWWAAWIVSNILTYLSLKMWMRADDIASMRSLIFFDLMVTPLSIASSLLFILVIRRITTAQVGGKAFVTIDANA